MFSLFKKSCSAADVAAVSWQVCREWPAKHGATFQQDFSDSLEKDIEEVFHEMIYYLGFATDYAFFCQLEKQPQVEKAVRGGFRYHLAGFAREHRCKPIPRGGWMGEGLIWIPSDTLVSNGDDPLANLEARFTLYGQSLARRRDRSAGERTAHLLAALCGTLDIAFISYARPLFLGQWRGVQTILSRCRIRA